MTRRTNARLAGWCFLLYIATGITDMVVFSRTTAGAEGTAAKLASIAAHAPLVGLTVVFTLLEAVYAVVLGVTLYALTRDQDHDLAILGMSLRVVEGTINALSISRPLQLLSLATASSAAVGPDAAANHALGGQMLRGGGGAGGAGAFCFAIASLCFCYLFLRARSIPAPLAWLGLLSSVLWIVGMPLQLGGFVGGPATYVMWIPMGVFEVVLAFWLIIKGVATPIPRPTPAAS